MSSPEIKSTLDCHIEDIEIKDLSRENYKLFTENETTENFPINNNPTTTPITETTTPTQATTTTTETTTTETTTPCSKPSRFGIKYNLKLFCKNRALKTSYKEIFGNRLHLTAFLPTQYNIPVQFVPYDQGSIGSCTANAGCACIRIQKPATHSSFDPSRLFLYYVTRANTDSLDQEGAVLTDMYLALQRNVVSTESTWPYIVSKANTRPTSQAYFEASNSFIHSWGAVPNGASMINGIKQVLLTKTPLVMGIMVYESFENESVSRTGIIPFPNKSTEQVMGGHAVTVVGYDDNKNSFLLLNSWGPNWGTSQPNNTSFKGFCYLPYSYVSDPDLCDECLFFNGLTLYQPPIRVPVVPVVVPRPPANVVPSNIKVPSQNPIKPKPQQPQQPQRRRQPQQRLPQRRPRPVIRNPFRGPFRRPVRPLRNLRQVVGRLQRVNHSR